MQEKQSIKWNVIKYDDGTLTQDIEEILLKRFPDDFSFETDISFLHDPYLLTDMKKAVDRIGKAKKNNEKVMIFWDYDVDWVTSTSILMHFFKKIWIACSYRLPHRINDWYGMKNYFIDEISSLWVDLIITVDCWTRDIEVVKYAKSLWIDIIITDHHAVPEIIPDEAIALINPKRPDCNYPFKHLAWAWVAFKLMSALAYKYLGEKEAFDYIIESIDIAAIWTVADCMSIIWENRVIVQAWLKQLKKSRSRWIKKIIEEKIKDDLDSDIFWFLIGPRLNAAWRLDTPYKAVNLILNNSDSVEQTILEIEELNNKRKDLTLEFVADALEKINREDNIIFYHSTKITHWIIWIVAWRLTEKFYRPSIVLIEEEDKYVASCRSPDFFSIVEVLERYKDFFVAFWWHKQAAWFTIKKDRFEEFKSLVLDELNKLDFSQYKKSIFVDKVVDLYDLGYGFLDKINKFKPYWLWNIKPIFLAKDLEYTKISYLWKWVDHFKIDTKYGFKICAFGMWEFLETIKNSTSFSIVFELNLDTFNGKKNLLLNILDIII